MRKIFLIFILILVEALSLTNVSSAQISGGEVVLRHEIPNGFIYKGIDVSPSGMKGIVFLQPQTGKLYSDLLMLEIFDPNNTMILSKVLHSGWIFEGFTPDNKLILSKGDDSDSVSEIKILDINGTELLSIPDIGSRRLVFDLFGREMAIAALGYDGAYQPSIVYDAVTGREKFKYGPVNLAAKIKNKNRRPLIEGPRLFLPIGKDNLFLVGLGATILLQQYDKPGYLWKIDNIGGNINEGKFLDQDYLAVSYYVPERRYKEGLAIIRWKDGEIVFRIENYIVNDRREKDLPVLSVDYLYLDEDFNLNFVYDDGQIFKIHFNKENKKWDENLKTAYKRNFGKSIAAGKGRPRIIKGHIYYAEEENGEVVIRRVKLN